MAEDKGHKPSKKKLKKARKDGKAIKSPILSYSFGYIACLLCLLYTGSSSMISIRLLLEYTLTRGYQDILSISGLWGELFLKIITAPLLLMVFVSIIIEGLQVGVVFEPSILSPRASRIDLFAGLGKVFSNTKQSVGVGIKFLVLSLVFSRFFNSFFFAAYASMFQGSSEQVGVLWLWWVRLIAITFVILLMFGGVNYFFNFRKFYRELSMSRDEVMREYREEEGDPHIRAMRLTLHHELMQQTVARIRKARVIIVERNR